MIFAGYLSVFAALTASLLVKSKFYAVFLFLTAAALFYDVRLYQKLSLRRYDRGKLRGEFTAAASLTGVVLTALFCWVFFIADSASSFECSKETMRCVYSRATLFDPALRVAKTYDLSTVTHASLKTVRVRRNHFYYTVWEKADGSSFKTPISIHSHGAAEREVDKINAFLNGGERKYAYYSFSTLTGFPVVVRFGFPIFLLIFSLAIGAVLQEYYKRSRPKPLNAVDRGDGDDDEDDYDEDEEEEDEEDDERKAP